MTITDSTKSPSPTPFYRAAWFYAALVSGAAYLLLLLFWQHAWAWKAVGLLAVTAVAAGVTNWFRPENRYFRVGVWLLGAGAVSGAPTVAAWAKNPGSDTGFLLDASPLVSVALIAAGCFSLLIHFLSDNQSPHFAFGDSMTWTWARKANDVRVTGDTTISGDGNNIVNSVVTGANRQELEEFRKLFERQLAAKDEQIAEKDGQLAVALRAVERLQEQALAGNNDAAAAISDARKTGDTSTLLEVLLAERDKGRDEQAELNREIAAIAFLSGEIDKSGEAIDALLREDPDDIDALTRRGQVRYLRGELPGAEADLLRAIDLGRGNPSAEANAFGILGLIYRIRGDLESAEAMHRSSLAMHQKLGSRDGIAGQYGNIGVIFQVKGKLNDAEKMHLAALAIYKEICCREGMAAQYGNLGLIYRIQGALERSEEMHRKSLAINREIGRRIGMAYQYGSLGVVFLTRGMLEKAEEMVVKSLAIHEEIGCREGMAIQHGNLGLIYQAQGELEKAGEAHRKSLTINENLGNPEGMASVYGNIGVTYLIQGDLKNAEEMFDKSLTINVDLGHRVGMATQYGNLSSVFLTRGEIKKAEEMLRKSLEIHGELGSLEGMAKDLGNLGGIRLQRGDLSQAREHWTRSRDLFAEIGIPQMVEQVQGWIDALPEE